uniref:Uncharacterized protein n=1 Tax=Siphoviridae sp. ctB3v5 TaxID=2826186 RepID=A0A8S5M9Q1_9CAUD|nr:MAG TPA: hypothetical protein [Siphoviridae sp. ctB3v5]
MALVQAMSRRLVSLTLHLDLEYYIWDLQELLLSPIDHSRGPSSLVLIHFVLFLSKTLYLSSDNLYTKSYASYLGIYL